MNSNSINVYEQLADKYDSWFDRHSAVFQSELDALKKVIPQSGKGLEVGVGSGRFASALGIQFGIDPSPKMCELARSRGVNVSEGIAEDLPYSDGEFDFVLLGTVLCYLKDPLKGLSEAKRVLKSNGTLIIAMIDRDSPLGRDYETRKKENPFYRDAQFHSTMEVLDLLKKVNFEEKEIYQTIFSPIERIEKVEQPILGYGKGGFVVISAQRSL